MANEQFYVICYECGKGTFCGIKADPVMLAKTKLAKVDRDCIYCGHSILGSKTELWPESVARAHGAI